MSESKPKPSEPTKTAPEIKKPGLEIKPVQELELDQTELEKITGGNCAPGGDPRGRRVYILRCCPEEQRCTHQARFGKAARASLLVQFDLRNAVLLGPAAVGCVGVLG